MWTTTRISGEREIYAPLARMVGEITGDIENAVTIKKLWQEAKKRLVKDLTRRGFNFLKTEGVTMSSEREERALDALIVSQLRATRDDEIDVEHLPELNDEEREALDSLGPNFVERLLAGEIDEPSDDPPEEAELAMGRR